MKVFLAGCENIPHFRACLAAKVKNNLISYYHADKTDKGNAILTGLIKRSDEMICDSGLFTLMFGAGKGGSHSLGSMQTYVREYLQYAKIIDSGNVTFVEADVHKLLGMPAVFELRKRFEDSGLKVLYTWHIEEGIDGLYKLADKYDYIALSVPELRVLFTGKKMRYQDGVKDLLSKIRTHCGTKMPKIHLLGNTVQETMETNLAYSCDSTSYIAGVKFGSCIIFKDKKLGKIHIRSSEFKARLEALELEIPEDLLEMEKDIGGSGKRSNYIKTVTVSCHAYAQYQSFLDKNYKFIGGK